MKVTIIGTGNMGRAIAARMLAGGHAVSFVGTYIARAQELADEMAGEGDVEASDRVGGAVAQGRLGQGADEEIARLLQVPPEPSARFGEPSRPQGGKRLAAPSSGCPSTTRY